MPAATTLSRSHLRTWDTTHLTHAATQWAATAQRWEDTFTAVQHHITAPWTGHAAHSAWQRAAADRIKVLAICDDLRAAAHAAHRGAERIDYAKHAALAAITDAEADGFIVGDDFSISDTTYSPTAAIRAARQTLAEEHATHIDTTITRLLDLDQHVATNITNTASHINELTFDDAPLDYELLDSEQRPSVRERQQGAIERARAEAAEPRNPVPEKDSWPPPDTPISGGTPGGEPHPDGLGPPVPGESLAEQPQPPAWQPKDVGSGGDATFGTWEPRLPGDQLDKWEIDAARELLGIGWPNAARNMEHYFGVTGTPLDQNVGEMLHDLPTFSDDLNARTDKLGANAIGQAQALGATGPLTFPVNTDWDSYTVPESQRDWYLALGTFDHTLTGEVTVYPPAQPGGRWSYSLDADVHLRDRYNWDIDKSTPIGGLPISDSKLARFHLIGWAKEFTMTGSAGVHSAG